jgi:hypothetical protein
MNYVSAVYAVVILIIAIDWLSRGKKEYRGQTDRKESVNETLRRSSIVDYRHGGGVGTATAGAGDGARREVEHSAGYK